VCSSQVKLIKGNNGKKENTRRSEKNTRRNNAIE
jgi:hypothetical protein